MADGNYGMRDIVIDLTVTGARVIRDATLGHWVKIASVEIIGTGHATLAAPVVLRKEAATVTNDTVVFSCDGKAAQAYQIYTGINKPQPLFKGLYMDDPVNAWAAGSRMIIHTA